MMMLLSLALDVSGAKMAEVSEKEFRFDQNEAKIILTALGFPSTSFLKKLRLNQALEWAIYLKNNQSPDPTSFGVERPSYNQIQYQQNGDLILKGYFFDLNTALPKPSSGLRYQFISPPIHLGSQTHPEWETILKSLKPPAIPNNFVGLLTQKEITKRFHVMIYSTYDLKGKLAYSVGMVLVPLHSEL